MKRKRLALSEPVEGASGKTGTWRTYHPVVDRKKCNACGLCTIYCPEAAMDPDFNVDLAFCKGCGICANECPKKAIAMAEEER